MIDTYIWPKLASSPHGLGVAETNGNGNGGLPQHVVAATPVDGLGMGGPAGAEVTPRLRNDLIRREQMARDLYSLPLPSLSGPLPPPPPMRGSNAGVAAAAAATATVRVRQLLQRRLESAGGVNVTRDSASVALPHPPWPSLAQSIAMPSTR